MIEIVVAAFLAVAAVTLFYIGIKERMNRMQALDNLILYHTDRGEFHRRFPNTPRPRQ